LTATLSAPFFLLGKLDRELQIYEQRDGVARDHHTNHAVKQSPWHRLSTIDFEDLNGLKRGKSQSRARTSASPPPLGPIGR